MPGVLAENAKTGDDNCTEDGTVTQYLTSNCMMLLPTPQMLSKSGINKGNAMNYLPFIVRIVHVCFEKQRAVKPRGQIGGNHCGELKEYPTIRLPLPYQLPYPPKNLFIFRADNSYFCLFYFWKIHFTHFSHNYDNYSKFGMFHVPDFIDRPPFDDPQCSWIPLN